MVFGLKRIGLPKKAPAEPPQSEPAPSGKSSGSNAKSALTVNEFVARTKRCREKGLEPTKPELIAYARYLGIDPIADGDLMWITDEALNAPLPSEWTEHHDSADRVFYYHVQTHASSWTHPLEQLHRDTYKTIVNFRSGDLSKEDRTRELEKLRGQCEEAEREAHKELQAWSEHTDEQGQKFYYNREHQRSVWTDPRPARCHALYLQMKALRVLSKQFGQSAPAPLRGLQPLSEGADSGRDNFERENLLPGHQGKSKKDRDVLRGGFDDTEGVGLPQAGHMDLSSWGNGSSLDDEMGGGEGRKKKKKKKGQSQESSEASSRPDKFPGAPGGLNPMSSLDSPRGGGGGGGLALGGGGRGMPGALGPIGGGLGGGLPDTGDGGLFGVKKPGMAQVEEARRDLAMPSIGGGMPGIRPLGHNNPFGGGGRLGSPPAADGLSTVGRAKVRAGIRLEPLHGGA